MTRSYLSAMLLAVGIFALGPVSSVIAATAQWPIFINEVLSDPATDWDGNGSYNFHGDEWVELYNVSNKAIDISGLILQDPSSPSPANPTNFTIPNGTVLGPNCFIVFYGSQTGFQIANGGDQVILWEPTLTTFIDRFQVLANPGDDSSWKRKTDGNVTIVLSDPCPPGSPGVRCPNPGTSNNDAIDCGQVIVPTFTPTPTAPPTNTPTVTPTGQPTSTPTPTPTATPTCSGNNLISIDFDPPRNATNIPNLAPLTMKVTGTLPGLDPSSVTLNFNGLDVNLTITGADTDFNATYFPVVPHASGFGLEIVWTVCDKCNPPNCITDIFVWTFEDLNPTPTPTPAFDCKPTVQFAGYMNTDFSLSGGSGEIDFLAYVTAPSGCALDASGELFDSGMVSRGIMINEGGNAPGLYEDSFIVNWSPATGQYIYEFGVEANGQMSQLWPYFEVKP